MNEPSSVEKTSKKYGKPNQIGQMVTPEELKTFEPILAEKLKEMMNSKDSATKTDDFDKVVSLRNGIEYLRDKARDLR